MPEQKKIVAEPYSLQKELDGMEQLQSETASEIDALLPAILDRTFKGKLI